MEESKHHHSHAEEDLVKIPVKLLVSILVIIAVLILGFFILKSGAFSGIFGGGTISEKQATTKLLSFFATQVPDSTVNLISSSKQGVLYEINVTIDGQETTIPVTADGKYIVVDRIPLG